MRSRWPILLLLSLLASLLVPGIASASTVAGAETRVWASDFADGVGIGVERSLTLELHQRCEPTYDQLASDSLLTATNARLQRTLRELFRETDILPGGTAGAIRHELKTGELVGGKSHIKKGRQRVTELGRILEQENLSPADRSTAERVLQDLRDALEGR